MSLISGLCRHFRTSLVTVTSSSTRSLTTTPSLGMAAMMKKRKRVDPMQQRQRDERKRKKLQKAVKKLSKKPRIVKPVWEMELPADVAQNPQDHNRNRIKETLEFDESERRALLAKEWARFAGVRHKNELRQHDRIIMCRQEALDELRRESFDLYAKAIALDEAGLPFVAAGPTATPPAVPTDADPYPWLVDGFYEDITKKYEVQYADTKKFLEDLISEESRARRAKKKEAKIRKQQEEDAKL